VKDLSLEWRLSAPANWELPKPLCSGQKLLVLDLPAALATGLEQMGWRLTLAAQWAPPMEREFVVDLMQEFPLGWESSFDAIWAPLALGFATHPQKVVQQLMLLLKPQGYLWLDAWNSLHHQLQLELATRELRPWPQQSPRGRLWNESALQSMFPQGERTEDMDPLVRDPNWQHWQNVAGLDATLRLPQDPMERRRFFVRSWRLSLQSKGLVEDPLDAVEKWLAQGELAPAAHVLEGFLHRMHKDARVAVLWGVLCFYRQEWLQAYEAFLKALELGEHSEDVWMNLWDTSEKLERQKDVLWLMEVKNAVWRPL
jgi:hypothetical protein